MQPETRPRPFSSSLTAAFKERGAVLVVAGVLVTSLPHVVTTHVGRYAMGMHPGILLGVSRRVLGR
jgi:hypothetical protein